jgi:ADP-ribose pyrophosphatase
MNQSNARLVYSCRIFDIWEEDILLPNGKTSKQTRIDHKPTIAVAALNEKNEILLISQYRNAVKKNLLEIPAGTMTTGEESPLECARRELAEETGYQAQTFSPLFEGYLVPGYCNEYMYFFLARDLFAQPLPPDEDEFIEIFPTTLMKAKELLRKGDIVDVKTGLGIILADSYLSGKGLFKKSKTNLSKTSL